MNAGPTNHSLISQEPIMSLHYTTAVWTEKQSVMKDFKAHEREQCALIFNFYCDIYVLDYSSWLLGFFIYLSLVWSLSPFV